MTKTKEKHVVDNVFLPRRLPEKASSDSLNGVLVRFVLNHFPGRSHVDLPYIKTMRKLLETWQSVQQEFIDHTEVQTSLQNLKPGDTFAIFVRAQNAAFTVTRSKSSGEGASDADEGLMTVFRTSANNERVMGSPGDLFSDFPERAVRVPFVRFTSSDFAKQVASLCNDTYGEQLPKTNKAGNATPETRDVPDPSYVTSWLLGAIAGSTELADDVIQVRKVIRDDVVWKESQSPWRRSGEWMAVKAVLHTRLISELGSEKNGTIVYKSLMIECMAGFISSWENPLEVFSSDVLMQILAKISRRMAKLKDFMDTSLRSNQSPMPDSALCDRVTNVLVVSSAAISKCQKAIDKSWEAALSLAKESTKLNRSQLQIEKHVKHQLNPQSRHRLQKAMDGTSHAAVEKEVAIPTCPRRHDSSVLELFNIDLLTSVKRSSSEIDNGQRLRDFETWTRECLWPQKRLDVSAFVDCSAELFNLLNRYMVFALEFYTEDPVGCSRMVLTSTMLVLALDSIACCTWPMLLQHRLGIDVGAFSTLLAPSRDDLEYLRAVEEHIDNRGQKACFPGLLEEHKPSSSSFASRFAQHNDVMCTKLREIDTYAAAKRDQKRTEVLQAQQEYDDLKTKARNLSCENYNYIDRYGDHHSGHSNSCQRCYFNRRADNISVDVYENPLPSNRTFRLAVVFELSIPLRIRYLRDALWLLNLRMFSVEFADVDTARVWRDHPQLGSWVTHEANQALVSLISSTKLFSQSHYSSQKIGTVRNVESYLKACGYNARYSVLSIHTKNAVADNSEALKSFPAKFRTMSANTRPYEVPKSWTEGTKHTQNDVLAAQASCPKDIDQPDLSEFKAFGSLRAGHRLQLRNLLRVLEMQSLDFDRASVFALIAQVLWQSGPVGHDIGASWSRESHIDLGDADFASEMLRVLFYALNGVRENWKRHNVLQVLVVTALRVLSLSEASWQNEVIEFLKECRDVAEDWCTRIEDVLSKMMSHSPEEIMKVRLKLVDVAATAALTFDIDERHFQLVIRDGKALVSWLTAITRIYDNILLSSSSMEICIERRNMLRRVRLSGLRMEQAIHTLLQESPFILSDFINNHWSDASQGDYRSRWECYGSPSERWYCNIFEFGKSGSTSAVTLQLDVLNGAFLVNGDPVGRLPESITYHQDYARVFGRSIFDVQPAAKRPGSFVTKHRLNGATFTFALQNDDDLIVIERLNDVEFELIPSRLFSGDFPSLLVSEYSHWIDKANGVVWFRSVRFNEDNFFDDNSLLQFRFDFHQSILFDCKNGRKLLDVRSTTFKELYQLIHRLEHHGFVHAFVHRGCPETDVLQCRIELPRMGLCFDDDGKGEQILLHSRDHQGMIVDPVQGGFGTLIGLKHGLLLRDEVDDGIARSSNRLLLLPHSDKVVAERSDQQTEHQQIYIGLDAPLRSPAFFSYQVDELLCQLRAAANQESWLYLCLLHAMSSHALPDPFTGLTGTESAMSILHSGRAWSCKPMSDNASRTLESIAQLCPQRVFYPKHLKSMQTVEWPQNIPSMAAHEGLFIAAQMISDDSVQLSCLFPTTTTPNEKDEKIKSKRSDIELIYRQYWRHHSLMNPCARLNDEGQRRTGSCPARRAAWSVVGEDEEAHNARAIAEACHQRVPLGLPVSMRKNLWSVLQSRGDLDGKNVELSNITSTISEWRRINVLNCFLDLYCIAKDVDREDELPLLLSFLAFRAAENEWSFLLAIQAVSAFHSAPDIRLPKEPDTRDYKDLDEHNYSASKVQSIGENRSVGFEDFSGSQKIRSESTLRLLACSYKRKVETDVAELIDDARRQWPSPIYQSRITSEVIGITNAESDINRVFAKWYSNRELRRFVEDVETLIDEQYPRHDPDGILAPCLSLPGSQSDINRHEGSHLNMTFPIRRPADAYSVEAGAIYRDGCVPDAPVICLAIEKHDNSHITRDIMPVELFHCSDGLKDDAVFMSMKKGLQESWNVPVQPKFKDIADIELLRYDLEREIESHDSTAKQLWKSVLDSLAPDSDDAIGAALVASGLWRRIVPAVVLPSLLNSQSSLSLLAISNHCEVRSSELESIIGATAVVWTLGQRARRCLRLLRNAPCPNQSVALRRELANPGHGNWSPKQHPEWLLLELEGNFLAREVQINVANSMLDAEENSVQQLNMGEGKSSVIVPFLAAALANGKQLARVTILQSLFRTNFDSLVLKLGGLLNRRIYCFPCRRDLEIPANKLRRTYERCQNERGVVLTQPEHRLSFDLKVLDHCRSEKQDAGELLELQRWLRDNARDVLDESDEILHVKYQVVYTLGSQHEVDGGDLRWKVAQTVLKMVSKHAKALKNEFPEHVEYGDKDGRSFQFTPIRLLSDRPYSKLCELIIDSILIGQTDILHHLRSQSAEAIRNFVLHKTVSQTDLNAFDGAVDGASHQNNRNQVLMLRGLLAFDVLKLVLSKRWRVNFGVNPTLPKRRMAVPYRAKDVASDRTEFGHPDVAIMYTLISYYNSGLNDVQMDDTFTRLYKLSDTAAAVEYERWIHNIINDNTVQVEPSLRSLSGVNLDDYNQKRVLYDLLRNSVDVADFWLGSAVFPVECKQFHNKLSTSAWDLCLRSTGLGAPSKKPTTGFSGTNDSQLLLPLSISQIDQKEVLGTNASIVRNLLLPENRSYDHLPSCISGKQLLSRVVENNAMVLLDVGALMLELDNASVALEWLNQQRDGRFGPIDAAVYFGDDNQLMVRDREGRICALAISPYENNLGRCVVYLDEVHTRGTDMRFPSGTHACVTLGKDLTKDRLSQACMRMRLLGQGHTLSFLAASEVHASIMKSMKGTQWPEVSDVLRWAIRNSSEAVRAGLMHWSTQGHIRCRKEAAEASTDDIQSEVQRKSLGNKCTEDEVTQLEDFYGGDRHSQKVPAIVAKRSQDMISKLKLTTERHLMDGILQRCQTYVSDVEMFARLLDEEQERELENELEEERHVERPGAREPRTPQMSQDVLNLAMGSFRRTSASFRSIRDVFKNTQVEEIFEATGWSNEQLFVTFEFAHVVMNQDSSIDSVDAFLREPTWLVKLSRPERMILISPFEANHLLPKFRSCGNSSMSSLCMFAPRLRRDQQIFLDRSSTIVPTSSQNDCCPLLMAQLDVFGGSLFFNSSSQQDAYCQFLGLLPRPRTDAQEAAYQNGFINVCGFVNPKHRSAVVAANHALNDCKFEKSPAQMVLKILTARGQTIDSRSSHVGLILCRAKKSLITHSIVDAYQKMLVDVLDAIVE